MTVRRVVAGLAASLAASAPAHAQIAVYDATSYAKLLQQAQTALQQLKQLEAQVAQGRQMLDSLNVNSHVNAIASQLGLPELRQFLPDVRGFEAAVKGDFSSLGELGARASQIRAETRIYTPDVQAAAGSSDAYATEALEQSGTRIARDMALGESIGTASAQRLQGLEQLRQSLDTAGDARAVLDLQARLSAEAALIQNDQVRLQGLAMVQQAQDRLQAQQDREAARRSTDEAEAAFRKVFQ